MSSMEAFDLEKENDDLRCSVRDWKAWEGR